MNNGAVLVTGVSTGIGKATVWELLGAGFRVFGTVRRARDTAAVEAAGATPIIVDVTQPTSVRRAHETISRALGDDPLVGVVNNAGVVGVGPVEHLDLEDLRRTFEVNLFGVVTVIQTFLPMLRASRGRIVNISSVSARVALPFSGSYAASKFALEGLSDSLRRELLGTGVAVIVIQPGSVKTAIWSKIAEANLDSIRGTIYQHPVAKMRELALRSGEQGLQPEKVGRAVVRALTSRKPPTRIRVVGRGRITGGLARLIPDRWIDRRIARRLFREETAMDEEKGR